MIKIVSPQYPDLLVRLESTSIQFDSGAAVLNDQKAEKEFLDFVKRSEFLELEIVENSSDQKSSEKTESPSKKAEEPSKKDKNSPETDPENLV